MKNFKKIVGLLLTLTVFSVFATSAYGYELESTEKIVPYYFEQAIVDENNEVIGTKITEASIKVDAVENGTLKTITEDIKYNLNDKTLDLTEIYKDEIKITEILIETSGDYYINGEKLSDKFLNTEVNLLGVHDPEISLNYETESGGNSFLTYYTNSTTGDAEMFYLKTYLSSYTNFFLDPPSDKTYIFKHAYIGANVSDFKMYANQVASARSTVSAGVATLIASGITILTPAVIIGLIGTSAAALGVYLGSNSGHEAMQNAQSLLINMDGHYVYP
ncbi:hypothetical protein [Paenibacillus senegalimassiliensis]|uniref:hypothetical protein n=1 Tax=Paenibacillus senegalimassiliensis TaxID=1737426 RepID=UPI00073EA8B9|nr:hypothetical protein [Paenibacillus senegalimassiliensis]